MRTHSGRIALAVVFACFAWGTASAGGILESVFARVDSSGWGASREKAAQMLGQPLLHESPEIVIVPAKAGKYEGTANFLFNGNGQLYNMSWYWTFPVTDIRSARRLNQDIVAALRSKYGKQDFTFSDGNPRKAKEAAKRSRDVVKTMNRIDELREEKGGELTVDEVKNALGRQSLMDMMATNFYTKLDLWNEGALWAYVNLLCSTDGTCYLHLQFVSKHLTHGEDYQPEPGREFSYSPMDRDMGLVAGSNAEMIVTIGNSGK